METRWVRWTYNPDTTKVGSCEELPTGLAAFYVDEGRCVYTTAPTPVSTVPVKPSTAVRGDKVDKDAGE